MFQLKTTYAEFVRSTSGRDLTAMWRMAWGAKSFALPAQQFTWRVAQEEDGRAMNEDKQTAKSPNLRVVYVG